MILRFFICTLFSLGMLFAQTKFPITVSVGNYGQLGYKIPNVAVSGGAEIHKSDYWANAWLKFDPTDKIAYGSVTQAFINGRAYWKPGKGFFIGGGANLRNIRFHDFKGSYWTSGPIACGGWSDGKLRLVIDGVFTRHDVRYDLRGISWTVLYDFKNRLRIGTEQGIYKLRSKISGHDFGTNLTSEVFVGYVF